MKDYPLFILKCVLYRKRGKQKWLEFIIIVLISVSLTSFCLIFILALAYLSKLHGDLIRILPRRWSKADYAHKPTQTQGPYATGDETSGAQGDQMSSF